MGIGIDSVFVFSWNVTKFVPLFMADGMGLGKRREYFIGGSKKMPEFTVIGASEKALPLLVLVGMVPFRQRFPLTKMK